MNARSFKAAGYAEVLPEEEMSGNRLLQAVHTVYGNREAIIGIMNASDSRDAANQVMALIERMAKRRHGEP